MAGKGSLLGKASEIFLLKMFRHKKSPLLLVQIMTLLVNPKARCYKEVIPEEGSTLSHPFVTIVLSNESITVPLEPPVSLHSLGQS